MPFDGNNSRYNNTVQSALHHARLRPQANVKAFCIKKSRFKCQVLLDVAIVHDCKRKCFVFAVVGVEGTASPRDFQSK